MTSGLLLINLGTPNSADTAAVRTYLREFLIDNRVIDLPMPLRYLLVYGLILPFRSKKSAEAYQQIWTKEGSPLLVNSRDLANQLQKHLGADFKIALGMRYGQPSIQDALAHLKECETITILPLYPQYSSAATGSVIEKVMRSLQSQEVLPNLTIIRDFYQHPAYLKAQAQVIKRHLKSESHLIFSYHGIPERQILKSGCQSVCENACPPITTSIQACYRAQCFATSRLLAAELALKPEQYSSAFQSRLGKTPWIQPYTDEILIQLAAKGIKDIAVACPSFVSDCLETLEEIGIRAKAQWQQLGGQEFTLIPCLNTDPSWLQAVKEIVSQ